MKAHFNTVSSHCLLYYWWYLISTLIVTDFTLSCGMLSKICDIEELSMHLWTLIFTVLLDGGSSIVISGILVFLGVCTIFLGSEADIVAETLHFMASPVLSYNCTALLLWPLTSLITFSGISLSKRQVTPVVRKLWFVNFPCKPASLAKHFTKGIHPNTSVIVPLTKCGFHHGI